MRIREEAEDKLIRLRNEYFMLEFINVYHNEINSNPNLLEKEKKEDCDKVTSLVKEFYNGGVSAERGAEINKELLMILGIEESSSKPENSINNNSEAINQTKELYAIQVYNNINDNDSNNGNAINNDNDCSNNGNDLNILE
jgi:hypothetical protein